MPLAPTTYCAPMPGPRAATSAAAAPSSSPVVHSPAAALMMMMVPMDPGSSINSRRPPLPPAAAACIGSSSSSKIAVIRPNNSLASFASRSPSPPVSSYSSSSSCSYPLSSSTTSSRRLLRRQHRFIASPSPAARRVFPQPAADTPGEEDVDLDGEAAPGREQAPVVFDASLNFVLGIGKQRVRQSFRPTASHLEPRTASSHLSDRISSFLQRTDHIMDEWRRLGKSDVSGMMPDHPVVSSASQPDGRSLGRSRSATNIMIRGYRYFSRASSLGKSPSRTTIASSRLSSANDDDQTLSQCDEEVLYSLLAPASPTQSLTPAP